MVYCIHYNDNIYFEKYIWPPALEFLTSSSYSDVDIDIDFYRVLHKVYACESVINYKYANNRHPCVTDVQTVDTKQNIQISVFGNTLNLDCSGNKRALWLLN